MDYEKLSLEEIEVEMEKKYKLRQLKSLAQEDHRAQSVTVGTAGGGTTEITLRGMDGSYLWLVQQPVEVIELINQLAANIGCHIHVQPREDFSSWRQWKDVTEVERLHLNGHPPFPNDLAVSRNVGKSLASPQDKLKIEVARKAEEKENAVATKKTVNKRSSKRSRPSTK